jgi:hypothetical protein
VRPTPLHVGGHPLLNPAPESKYKTKGTKAGISGYSMGSRGCNRFAVTYPELVASAGCSAGAAEQDYDGTLTQDPSRTASATFPLLSKVRLLAIWLVTLKARDRPSICL